MTIFAEYIQDIITFLFGIMVIVSVFCWIALHKVKQEKQEMINIIASHPNARIDYQERVLVVECNKGSFYIDENDSTSYSYVQQCNKELVTNV